MEYSVEENRELIRRHERHTADLLAARVIDKPSLSIWMILIPVIFVHFFYRLNKISQGRKEFADNYMITRDRALDEACGALAEKRRPDLQKLCRMSSVPEKTYPAYRRWLGVLIELYQDLLKAEGERFDELVRCAYPKRNTFLMVLNQLSNAEKEFDAALEPTLAAEVSDAHEVIRAMERHTRDLRRQMTDQIFSSP